MKLPVGKEKKKVNEAYYMNKIGHYAYAYGFIRSVLEQNISAEAKLKKIADEMKQLDENLTILKERENNV